MRVTDFWDDDYGTIEIVPAENLAWATAEQEKIRQFSEAHRAPDGFGWTDVYVRDDVAVTLATRAIPFAEVDAALSPIVPPFDRITCEGKPIGNPSRTAAYGPAPKTAIFVEKDGDLVKEIWALLAPDRPEDVDAACDALFALARWDLLLIDWSWGGSIIPLADDEQLWNYLASSISAASR